VEGYNSEVEQIEALRKWWEENGAAVFVGIALGIGAIVGWKYYQGHVREVSASASTDYNVLMDDLRAEKKDKIVEQANQLSTRHDGTPYATMAALASAKQLVVDGKLEEAKAKLEWTVEHATPEPLKHIAKVRLVRVLVAQKSYEEALKILDSRVPVGFEADYAELRGDVHVAQGKSTEARTAYKEAISYLTEDPQRRETVEMKLTDVAGADVAESTPQ
jgi:predicted negative regulator of RcsB-dependent stress response